MQTIQYQYHMPEFLKTINHISLVFLTDKSHTVLKFRTFEPSASVWVSQTKAASWNLLLDVQISHPLRLWLPPERKLLLEHRFKGPAGDIQQLHQFAGYSCFSETRQKICCRKNLMKHGDIIDVKQTENTGIEIVGTIEHKNPERLRNLNLELRGLCLQDASCPADLKLHQKHQNIFLASLI